MALKLITPPSAEPVALAEAKVVLRIDHTDEDLLIQGLITAARETCEHILGRAIMTQTWELVLDDFPCGNDIELAHPPVQSITSVKYIDAITGNLTTLSNTQYTLDSDSEPCFVVPARGVSWPATDNVANALRVRYVAGYVDADSVPQSIKTWILLAVKFMQENCPAGADASSLPHDFYGGFLDRYRIWVL